MDFVSTLILAVLVPLAAAAAKILVDKVEKHRAYERIKGDPRMRVGVVFEEILVTERATPLVGPCQLTVLEVGHMEVKTLEGESSHHVHSARVRGLHSGVSMRSKFIGALWWAKEGLWNRSKY